ncbi:MAG: 16S rRNA processing protein RimM [Abditibacteriota bacterium]|nr:16S rRNA processing protein RimM [Abditibacteriota bacterium]
MLRDDEIAIGRVLKPFGIKGDIKLGVMTDFPGRFDAGKTIRIRIDDSTVASCRIVRSAAAGPAMTLHLEGVEDRNAAEALAGCYAFVTEDELMELEDGEEYVFRLIGMQVVTTDGRQLGEITDVLQGGANDVYVIDGRLLIPKIPECVLDIDREKRIVTIYPMKGLLPDAL